MEAAQALALRGLGPVPGWDELPAACFGVIYRAAIYIAAISAAVWGRCEEARGEGSSLPPPRARPRREGTLPRHWGQPGWGQSPAGHKGCSFCSPQGIHLRKKLCVGLPGFIGVGFANFSRK